MSGSVEERHSTEEPVPELIIIQFRNNYLNEQKLHPNLHNSLATRDTLPITSTKTNPYHEVDKPNQIKWEREREEMKTALFIL